MMRKVIMQGEESIQYHYKEYTNNQLTSEIDLQRKALIRSALQMSEHLNINNIILFTKSGKLAKIAAAYRPKPNIFAFTQDWNTFTNAALYFGIKSRYGAYDYHINGLEQALQTLVAS